VKSAARHSITLRTQRVVYRITPSASARKLRIRVGPNGVEVIRPTARTRAEVAEFLRSNQSWVLGQLDRVSRLGAIQNKPKPVGGRILLRGVETPVRIKAVSGRQHGNHVVQSNGSIIIRRSSASRTPTSRSLENWLRREARRDIEHLSKVFCAKLRRRPNRIYIMGQRTKWGNCSKKRNLSFNWRLIMAPPEVLNYIVAHELVHLAVPDHSHRFWLTLQSVCPGAERAKLWLARNSHRVLRDLRSAR